MRARTNEFRSERIQYASTILLVWMCSISLTLQQVSFAARIFARARQLLSRVIFPLCQHFMLKHVVLQTFAVGVPKMKETECNMGNPLVTLCSQMDAVVQVFFFIFHEIGAVVVHSLCGFVPP